MMSVQNSLTYACIIFCACPTSAPSRSLGKSELLVEASFADLRHCGDGNLTKAHDLVKKVSQHPCKE